MLLIEVFQAERAAAKTIVVPVVVRTGNRGRGNAKTKSEDLNFGLFTHI